MRVFDTSAASLDAVASILRRGGVVGIPTETVYGLAANALNPAAVEEIYRIKGRPSHNPLIVHIDGLSRAEWFAQWNPIAEQLANAFWPGPLTIIVRKRDSIPDVVSAGLPTVGLRAPSHPVMQEILSRLEFPLAAPSANPSNYLSPTQASHVVEHLDGKLDYVIDGGACKRGVESTIVDTTQPGRVTILRPGPISAESLSKVLGVEVQSKGFDPAQSVLTSPGQMRIHYSPRTPLSVGRMADGLAAPCACVHFEETSHAGEHNNHFFLSRNGDPREAESRLYALLQELDAGNYAHIHVDSPPETPDWDAIRDRLSRASKR
jgi:L-threonylcarbamoyladenylate synthase